MTTLLPELIKKVEASPPQRQDEIAKEILEDFENGLRWQKTLAQPQGKLEKLTEKALEHTKARRTKKMDFDEL